MTSGSGSGGHNKTWMVNLMHSNEWKNIVNQKSNTPIEIQKRANKFLAFTNKHKLNETNSYDLMLQLPPGNFKTKMKSMMAYKLIGGNNNNGLSNAQKFVTNAQQALYAMITKKQVPESEKSNHYEKLASELLDLHQKKINNPNTLARKIFILAKDEIGLNAKEIKNFINMLEPNQQEAIKKVRNELAGSISPSDIVPDWLQNATENLAAMKAKEKANATKKIEQAVKAKKNAAAAKAKANANNGNNNNNKSNSSQNKANAAAANNGSNNTNNNSNSNQKKANAAAAAKAAANAKEAAAAAKLNKLRDGIDHYVDKIVMPNKEWKADFEAMQRHFQKKPSGMQNASSEIILNVLERLKNVRAKYNAALQYTCTIALDAAFLRMVEIVKKAMPGSGFNPNTQKSVYNEPYTIKKRVRVKLMNELLKLRTRNKHMGTIVTFVTYTTPVKQSHTPGFQVGMQAHVKNMFFKQFPDCQPIYKMVVGDLKSIEHMSEESLQQIPKDITFGGHVLARERGLPTSLYTAYHTDGLLAYLKNSKLPISEYGHEQHVKYLWKMLGDMVGYRKDVQRHGWKGSHFKFVLAHINKYATEKGSPETVEIGLPTFTGTRFAKVKHGLGNQWPKGLENRIPLEKLSSDTFKTLNIGTLYPGAVRGFSIHGGAEAEHKIKWNFASNTQDKPRKTTGMYNKNIVSAARALGTSLKVLELLDNLAKTNLNNGNNNGAGVGVSANANSSTINYNNNYFNNKYNKEVKTYKPTNNALMFNETNKSSGMHNYLQGNFYNNSENFNQSKYMLLQSHVKATTVKASMLCAYFRVVLQPLFKKASMSAARTAKLAALVSQILRSGVRAATRLKLKNVDLNEPLFSVTNEAVKYGRAKPAGRQVLQMFRPKVSIPRLPLKSKRRTRNGRGPYSLMEG